MFNMKIFTYLFVLFGFSSAWSGSYEDFFTALQWDNAATVQQLLRRGFDPNSVDESGQPALLLAVKSGAFKVAEVLIDDSATRIDVRTPQDESPLMLAALKGNLQLCKKLVARNAEVNKAGWTPLHYAATGAHIPVMQLLLAQSANVDAASPNGSTPLMMAAMYGNAAAVKLLLAAGADVGQKNSLGLTALNFATQAQRQESTALIAAAMRARGIPTGTTP